MNFSVLMPVYYKERPEFLYSALSSVFNQTLPPSEVVLVKDGPFSDELNKTIDSIKINHGSELNVIELKENLGIGKALNIGLLNCSHDIVARMDSNDICLPVRFEKQITFLKNNPEIDLVGSWISEFIVDPKNIISVRKVPSKCKNIYNFAKFRCPVNHMAVMFRKGSVFKAGNYQDFAPIEDYYLWVRMLINGAKFDNIPESLVLVRIGKRKFSRRRGLMYLKKELELFKLMRKENYINNLEYAKNIVSRISIRLLPEKLLNIIYSKFVRQNSFSEEDREH